MKFWYDTEFLEDGETIDLISIGIVAEDERELYLVNADADWDRIRKHDWLMENVVPQLPGEEEWLPKPIIAALVKNFLLDEDNNPELWAWYSAYDHVVLCQLWGKMIDLPEGIPMFTHDLRAMMSRGFASTLPKQDEGVHDALADARHLKTRYDYWIQNRKGRAGR